MVNHGRHTLYIARAMLREDVYDDLHGWGIVCGVTIDICIVYLL